MICTHNHRCRYTHGFLCEDCHTFFPKESATYRSGELLSDLSCVFWNLNVDACRKGLPKRQDCLDMCDRLNQLQPGGDHEALIADAELLLAKYGAKATDATVELKVQAPDPATTDFYDKCLPF